MSQQYIQDLFKDSLAVKQAVIAGDGSKIINQMATAVTKSITAGGKLLLCGNGGSAADAQHLAAELVVRLRSSVDRKGLAAMSLAMDSSTLTACGNDYSFDAIFARSLAAMAKPADILLVLSTSGNSNNIIEAVHKAKELNIFTLAFLGGSGGQLKGLTDIDYCVPSDNTARIQEMHIMLGHALLEVVENNLLQSNFISID